MAGLRYGMPLGQQCFCQGNSFHQYILVNRTFRLGLKQVAEIIFIQGKGLGDRVQRQGAGQVGIDVIHNRLGPVGGRHRSFWTVFFPCLVDKNQNLQKQCGGHDIAAVLSGFLQGLL